MSAFKGVLYWINRDITPNTSVLLKESFTRGGGKPAQNRDSATHIVTLTVDDGTPVREGVHLVTPDWVRRSARLTSKQEERFYSPDPAMLFSGIVGCAQGLPKADVEVIQAGIVGLGGQWRGPLTKEVTHLFADKPEGDKYETAMKHAARTGIRVVLPHWFDDSFKAAHLVPTRRYEFPDPLLFQNKAGDDLADGMSSEQAELVASLLHSKPDSDMEQDIPLLDDLFEGKAVMLSETLDLTAERRKAFEGRLSAAGARLVDHADDTDILVTAYQEGDEFYKAFTESKTVGTLEWLIFVLRENRLSNPRDQLLHFPRPRGICPGFKDLTISITTYTGVARDYIKHLIETLGATFTATMDASTTHLIAGGCQPNQPLSAKIDSAERWGIPVVNHLWLEDCLADWHLKHLATERYLQKYVEFGGIVGDRRRMTVRLPPEWQKAKPTSSRARVVPVVEAPPRQVRSSHEIEDEMDVDDQNDAQPEEEDEVEMAIANPTLTPRSPAKSTSSRPKISPRVSRASNGAIPNSTPSHASVLSKRGPPPSPEKPSSSSAKRRRVESKPSKAAVIDIPTDQSGSPSRSHSSSPSLPPPSPPRSIARRTAIKTTAKRGSSPAAPIRSPTPPGYPSAGRVRRSAAVAASSKLATSMQDANQFEVEMRGGKRKSLGNLGRIKVPEERNFRREEEESESDETVPQAVSSDEESVEEPPRKQGRGKNNMKENTPIAMPTQRVAGKGKLSKQSGSRARAADVELDDDDDDSDLPDEPMQPIKKKQTVRKQIARKRRAPEPSDDEVVVLVDKKAPQSKKRGRSTAESVTPAPAGDIWIMTTMVDIPPADKKKMEALGARFTTDPEQCTHLVVKGINRTEKFLCAMPRSPEIVTVQWVRDSAARGELQPESDYPVKDPENEKAYAFSLAKARERARKNGPLLKGHSFLVSPNVPNLAQIRKIIKANGGEYNQITGPPSVRAAQDKTKHLISCDEDSSYWRGWDEAGYNVYSSELVLRGCLRQEMRWDEAKAKLPKE